MSRVLVTGGAGYIGSHTTIELLQHGHEITVVDNLSNSSAGSLDAVRKLTGKPVQLHEIDIADQAALGKIMDEGKFDAVIHFAAFKAVGESVNEPLKYYQNNVGGFVSLLEAVVKHSIPKFVFSSTAAVYGTPPVDRVTEETPTNPESPYGWSKYMDEIVLRDCCAATTLHGTALRYFNVVGAHESGELGESPLGRPNNLLPLVVQATAGKIPPLTVYGTDYPTADGTCERDFIHVVDLARAHVAALEHDSSDGMNYHVFNVGTGHPTSVLKLIETFESVNGVKVPHTLGERRPGDPAAYFAAPDKAQAQLGWQATKTIEDACRDAWNWQTKHPNGFTKEHS
ncbi:MAG TPA: UDP-glucose 4-epimerase GalE [Candidatus Saccharimonadales bacterium]|nr:UDP-glucose 4-epimerase GalE [Candidatus Saccharimonadales bacterium]